MPTTLQAIMDDPHFTLSPVENVSLGVLTAPVLWAHSSDLPDPTPWLESGGVLLTDGVQFDEPNPTPADDYVARLANHGILALGFAIGVAHAEVPADVRDAARRYELPLFEVSRETPFVGVIRFVSEAVAAEEHQRLEQSLRAQRSVARAALRPDGLAEILGELERNLDCWVALFDASGTRIPVVTRIEIPPALADEVADAVANLLAKRQTAAVRLSHAGIGEVTLQTLGRTNALRGVLAVGAGADLDSVGVDLVDAVIALASIALEQSRTLDDARRRLRSGVLELLTAGVFGVADRTVEHLWGRLPSAPIRAGCLSMGGRDSAGHDTLRSALEILAEAVPGAMFFAEQGDVVITVTAAEDSGAVLDLASRHGARVGLSAESGWEEFGEAVRQARRAVLRTTSRERVAQFDDLARSGLLGHLEATHADDIARAMLRPLSSAGAPPDIAETLEVWLDHNAAWEPAAKALGIHRHTLRARVETAGALLDADLDSFGPRAELWTALQLVKKESAQTG